jgi:hypothetical protein
MRIVPLVGVMLALGLCLSTCSLPEPEDLSDDVGLSASNGGNEPAETDEPLLLCRENDWNFRRVADQFVEASGRVKNISNESLNHVEAVVVFEAKDGTFITSGSALIDYQPILPGQSSPWKVIETWNPKMAKASLRFKYLMGGGIRTKHED